MQVLSAEIVLHLIPVAIRTKELRAAEEPVASVLHRIMMAARLIAKLRASRMAMLVSQI